MKIAVLDDYLGVLPDLIDWSVLPSTAKVEIFQDHLSEYDGLVARLDPYDAVIGMRERTPFPASLLDRLPNLKLLVTLGTANPSFDIARATKLGIVVCGTKASGIDPIELTWALILAVARNLPHEDRNVRAGKWQGTLGTRLAGKTLGLVGLGRIGTAVARIAPAFGMRVIAWSENMKSDKAAECGAEAVSRSALFEHSDFVSVHLRLSPRTRCLIGRKELEMMRTTAFLVNTARGPIIDEESFVEVLRQRRIAGAGLDVFHEEPLPADHPLLALDNVVLSPHLGGVTAERYQEDYAQAVEDIVAWNTGEPVRVLNPEVLGSGSLRRLV